MIKYRLNSICIRDFNENVQPMSFEMLKILEGSFEEQFLHLIKHFVHCPPLSRM